MPSFPTDKAIILSQERSGTNFFISGMLSLWTDGIWFREIFRGAGDNHKEIEKILGWNEGEYETIRRDEPLRLWEALGVYAKDTNAPLFAKIFYPHVALDNALWTHFLETGAVIHLIRKNSLKQFVSLKLAETSGQWMLQDTQDNLQSNIRLTIDVREFERFEKRKTEHVEWAHENFSNGNYFVSFYEDISRADTDFWETFDPFGQFERATDVQFGFQKQNTRPLSEVIVNYDEVRLLDYDRDYGLQT
ncbi:MAG: hypothetical protein AAFR98_00470 [Pseudomonadota bacterium]